MRGQSIYLICQSYNNLNQSIQGLNFWLSDIKITNM